VGPAGSTYDLRFIDGMRDDGLDEADQWRIGL